MKTKSMKECLLEKTKKQRFAFYSLRRNHLSNRLEICGYEYEIHNRIYPEVVEEKVMECYKKAAWHKEMCKFFETKFREL